MYKAEREVKKLRAKHAACTIVIRNAGETIRDLAKSCGVAATTICALNHYRRHLVRGVRARSARISLFSFTSSEDSLVSITQPVILTIVVSLFSFTSSEDSLVSITQPVILTIVVSLTRNKSTRTFSNINTRTPTLEHRYFSTIFMSLTSDPCNGSMS